MVIDVDDKWYAFDIETSVNNQPKFSDVVFGSFPGNPFHPDNKLVLGGLLGLDSGEYIEFDEWRELPKYIAGHNLSFDLMYYLNEYGPYALKDLVIFDTQVAEYMLTGQQAVQVSLDDVAEKYTGERKIDKVKELWDAGYRTEDIPKSLLSEYLKQDCVLTAAVAKKQMALLKKHGMAKLFMDRMRSLKATILMTWTGIHIDLNKYFNLLKTISDKEQEIRVKIEEDMARVFGGKIVPNAASSKQLKAYLFGGDAGKYHVQEPVLDVDGNPVVYKTGKRAGEVKTKKVTHTLVVQHGVIEKKVTSEGTDDDILAFYPDVPQVTTIRDWRKINKEKTMLESYQKFIIAKNESVGVVHPQFNHTITKTGRLSSSNPNVQNLSNKDHEV